MLLRITIQVEHVDFDPDQSSLRLRGKNVRASDFIKLGQYHTLELAPNREFLLKKPFWDSIYLDRLDSACNVQRLAEVAAVVMEPGIAHICLITPYMTRLVTKVELTIPRKRPGNQESRTKRLNKFYDTVMEAIERQIDFEIVKCVIVASPGFFKDEFLKYMFEEAGKRGMKTILDNRQNFLAVHSSSGYM